MHVLLIKTSSMGDLIHTLPALTDAARAIPTIKFDWVVEKSFIEIPRWHRQVNRIIPVALRRWRKKIFAQETRAEWRQLLSELRETQYDLILDAQGLIKSAFISCFAKGLRVGLDFRSAREGLAACVYQRKHTVNFYQHAIVRMRSLFSQALDYSIPTSPADFGISREQFNQEIKSENYIVFLHGTTWTTKQWPESYWQQLANQLARTGYRVKISGGNQEEVTRAMRLSKTCNAIDVMPYLSISAMAQLLANAKGAVAVDTGFGHLAAALGIPTVSIYGATNADFTGALGERSIHLSTEFPCSPCLNRHCRYKKPALVTPACYSTITPEMVWQTLHSVM